MKFFSYTFLLLVFLFPITHCIADDYKIHFLHHSTGRNLIQDGDIYTMFDNYNNENSTNLIFSDEWSTPSGNYPYDYYIDTFSPDCLKNYTDNYNMIIFKHCFPGSDILEDIGAPNLNSSRMSLENYKLQYRALRDRFDEYPSTKFLIMTIPPRHHLHQLATRDRAARTNEFAEWVKGPFLTENGMHLNLAVFDFRALLTDSLGFLRYKYELNHSDPDCHPNFLANQTICPLFFDAIIEFYLASEATPVELKTFYYSLESHGVLLKWLTLSETNNYGFEIQRKQTNTNFKKVGFVAGNYTSNNELHYTYYDKLDTSGEYFYRLKQLDSNGSYTYSNTLKVSFQSSNSYRIHENYPNPFNSKTTISFDVNKPADISIKIYNMEGRLINTLCNNRFSSGFHQLTWDGTNSDNELVSSGIYMYKIEDNSKITVHKMLFLK